MRPVPPAPAMLSILRIVSGLIFLEHGTQKFLSFPAGRRGRAAASRSPISALMRGSSSSSAAC